MDLFAGTVFLNVLLEIFWNFALSVQVLSFITKNEASGYQNRPKCYFFFTWEPPSLLGRWCKCRFARLPFSPLLPSSPPPPLLPSPLFFPSNSPSSPSSPLELFQCEGKYVNIQGLFGGATSSGFPTSLAFGASGLGNLCSL